MSPCYPTPALSNFSILIYIEFILIQLPQRLDWGILLLRLVRHPAVDSTRLGEGILFFSILDMLASIMEPLETACYNSEDVNARTMFFKRICNEIHDIDNPANLQVDLNSKPMITLGIALQPNCVSWYQISWY